MVTGRILRIASAVALLIGGLVHLDLYFDGYRYIPDIGRSFVLNAIASGIVAAALVARREWFVRAAGIAVAAGTIIAFILSRRGDGLFDFREQGLNPSPQAGLALFVEIAAIVLLALSFVPAIAQKDLNFGMPILGASAAVAAVVLIGFGASAASDDGSSSTASSSESAPTASTPPASTPAGTDTTVAGATTVPGESTTTVAGGAAPAGGASSVAIAEFAFDAPALEVAKGTTVTWTNDDGVDHNVQAKDKSFASDTMGQGDTFEYTFDTDGDFAYICGIHPYMAGTITAALTRRASIRASVSPALNWRCSTRQPPICSATTTTASKPEMCEPGMVSSSRSSAV